MVYLYLCYLHPPNVESGVFRFDITKARIHCHGGFIVIAIKRFLKHQSSLLASIYDFRSSCEFVYPLLPGNE